MRLIRSNGRGFAFHFSLRQKKLLFTAIQLYPLVPVVRHRLSKSENSAEEQERQLLLEAALTEQREENRRYVLGLLKKPRRFRKKKSGVEVTLKRSEVECLLQVLNDVRIGSWLALGEPDESNLCVVTEETAKYYAAMHLCGMFESGLLSALGVDSSPKWADV